MGKVNWFEIALTALPPGPTGGDPRFVGGAVDHPGSKTRGEVVADDAVGCGSGFAEADDLKGDGPANRIETQLVAIDDVHAIN